MLTPIGELDQRLARMRDECKELAIAIATSMRHRARAAARMLAAAPPERPCPGCGSTRTRPTVVQTIPERRARPRADSFKCEACGDVYSVPKRPGG